MLFAPVVINLIAFKVNVNERNSAVTIGPYQQIDYFLSNKQNMGFGEENGDMAMVFLPVSIQSDADISDSNAAKASVV